MLPTPLPLRRSTLPRLVRRVSIPSYDIRQQRAGVVHFGVGRFHRGHQARYFDNLAELGLSSEWGVVGAGARSRRTRDILAAQDHLFTVVESGASGLSARVVGSMKHYLFQPEDRATLLRLLASPGIRLVTLTVTAEAYAVQGPLAATSDASVFTLLAEALDSRRRAGRPAFTVLSCDNISDNGAAARRAVLTAADRLPGQVGLADWITRNASFPTSLVDRITPSPYDELPALLAERFGLVDPCAVIAEPYSQWVVQDEFCSQRPPLQEVGVQFVSDVAPFAEAKMRLLNGAHCALGYVGSLAGHGTAAAAMADPLVAGFARELLTREVAPGLACPPGVDLAGYVSSVLRRIANPSLVDPLSRLSRRGSVRLPMYVAPSLRAALLQGRPARRLTLVLAAWARLLRTSARTCDDPLVSRLAPAARLAHLDARPLLSACPGLQDLAADHRWVADLQRQLNHLESTGWHAALQAVAEPPGPDGAAASASRRRTQRPDLAPSGGSARPGRLPGPSLPVGFAQ